MIQTKNMVASLLAVVLVATSTHATEYNVGSMSGWAVPNGRVNVFDHWAAEYEFHVGDILVFDFVKGMHNVAEVSKDDYEACNARNAMSTVTDGPAKITLESAGEHYFICSFPDHCIKGQRVTVKVCGLESLSQSPSAALQAAEGFSTTLAIVGMHSLSRQSNLATNY